MKKYYSMELEDKKASITIFGDITSWPWLKSDVSAWLLSQQLEQLGDVEEIDVFINSYGGEVAEGWAIYNALKRHTAKIHTYAEGFACSIASVIFMAGEQRTMENTSLLMIHQPSAYVSGNADNLEKEAAALRKMNEMSANAYREHVNISDEELAALIDGETWITPEDAVRMGFATDIGNTGESGKPSQSVRDHVIQRLLEKAAPEEPQKPVQAELDPEQIWEIVRQRLTGEEEFLRCQRPQETWSSPNLPENPIMKFLSAL